MIPRHGNTNLAGDRRVLRRDDDRVVRLLYLRQSGDGHLPAVLSQGNDTLALIAYLSTFAVGFVVRPFGALFFGRIGDLVGRKYAFLVTLLIMGGATALIGLLPTYATIGIVAPIASAADSRPAGTGARRRIRRRCGLCRRARAGWKARASTRASSRSPRRSDCSSPWQ